MADLSRIVGQLKKERDRLQQQLTGLNAALAAFAGAYTSDASKRAAAVKTTARSRRNSVVVAAFLGVLIGLLAALLWEPIMRRRAR